MTLGRSAVARVVAAVIEETPPPERVEDLDGQLRRAVERGAAAAGVSAQALWDASRSASAASVAATDEAQAIAEQARRR